MLILGLVWQWLFNKTWGCHTRGERMTHSNDYVHLDTQTVKESQLKIYGCLELMFECNVDLSWKTLFFLLSHALHFCRLVSVRLSSFSCLLKHGEKKAMESNMVTQVSLITIITLIMISLFSFRRWNSQSESESNSLFFCKRIRVSRMFLTFACCSYC